MWSQQVPSFLQVWPRQKKARTPRVSGELFELAFSSVEIFEQVITLILPLLTPVKRPYLHLSSIKSILDAYPEQSLALLYKAFSENTLKELPYGFEQTLDRIVDTDSKVKNDMRWLQLKRKLDI
jgi:hypothetical protein